MNKTHSILCGAIGLALFLAVQQSQAQPVPELLMPAPNVVRGEAPANALRSRPVAINREVLAKHNGSGPQQLGLTLFADRQHILSVRRAMQTSSGHTLYVGEVDQTPLSFVSIAIVDDMVTIEMQKPGANPCRVGPQHGGGYSAIEFSPDQKEECSEVESDRAALSEITSAAPAVLKYAPPPNNLFVDILALYTPAARDAAGGRSALVSAILNRWGYANQAHLNSGSTFQIRLVDIVEYSLDESTGYIDTFLSHIKNSSTITALMNSSGADMVHLFVAKQGISDNASVVGQATVNGDHGVTKWDASVAVFAHETGHNIGCRHQIAVDSDGPFQHAYEITYSFDGLFTYTGHTVMWATTSSMLPVFSDPNNYHRFNDPFWGLSPPLVLGTATADNARYIRENRMTRINQAQPKFYMEAGASGDASAAAPTGGLSEVLVNWRAATAADTNLTSQVEMASGNYPPMRITQKARLSKWYGASNVRIGN